MAYFVVTARARIVTSAGGEWGASGFVVIWNPPVVCPAGIVMDGGTLATSEPLPGIGRCAPAGSAASPTRVSVGTGCSSLTSPWLGPPPVTVAGKSVRLLMIPAMTLGCTVRVASAQVSA